MEGNDRETQGGLTQHVKPSCVYFNKSARYIEIFPFVVPRPRRAHPATDSPVASSGSHSDENELPRRSACAQYRP